MLDSSRQACYDAEERNTELGVAWMRILVAIVMFVGIASRALACYSGLTLIPTAETVGPGVLSIEEQVDTSASPIRTESHIINTQFGIGERFEAGVDFDLSDDVNARTLVNAKYVLVPHNGRALAFATGVYNINSSFRSIPYLTCCTHVRRADMHFGVMRTDSRNRWFAGLHRPLFGSVCLMADHISGEENASALGLECDLGDRYGLLIGKQYPNGSGDPSLTFHLVMTLSR